MTLRRSRLAVRLGTWALVAGLAAAPVVAAAQCSMMGAAGCGGMDHGAMAHGKKSASEKKLAKSIDTVLQDERGRAMLVDALTADRDFLDRLVARLLATPEGRAAISARLQAADAAPGGAAPAGTAQAALYVCPMHGDVTSPDPGTCPKCGMALERRPR